jgi:ankyrin repeat protein
MGFAAEVSHCLYLCGETWRKGDKGATNDMLARSLERQCGASAARAAEREDFVAASHGGTFRGTTQLIRATIQNCLPRVLQLVQLGAHLGIADFQWGRSALHWASALGHERIVRALLDGKGEGRSAEIDEWQTDGYSTYVYGSNQGWTSLMHASSAGHEGVVRVLLERGAKQQQKGDDGMTALHLAILRDRSGTVALLCAAPGSAAALALRMGGETALGFAVRIGRAACAAVLRAHGAPL